MLIFMHRIIVNCKTDTHALSMSMMSCIIRCLSGNY